MSTPEGRVKRKISALLKEHGNRVYYFMPVQSGYGKKTLDYLVCAYGYFFGIEAKRPGGEPTPKQQETMTEIALAGGYVMCVDGTNLDKLETTLDYLRFKRDLEANSTKPLRSSKAVP